MFDGIVAFLQSLPRELYVFIISVLPLIELRGAVPVGAALGLPFYLNFLVAVLGNMLPIPFILLFIPKILDFLARFKIFRPMVEWLRKKAEKNRGKIIKSAECRVQSSVGDGVPTSRNPEAHISVGDGVPTSRNPEAHISVGDGAPTSRNSEARISVGDGAPTSRNSEADTSFDTAMPCHLPLEWEGSKKSEKMTFAAFAALMLFVALPIPGTGAWTGALVASLFGLPRLNSFLSILSGVVICGVIMCLASYGILGFLSFLL